MLERNANIYKRAAQLEKATALVGRIVEHGLPLSAVGLMKDEHWRMLAKAAGVQPPSFETQLIVMQILRSN